MHALFIAAGILLSRVLGLVREALKARYLGATGSAAADAFNGAFGIPNLLQNLFGEGALSASFIPVYSNALARGDTAEANRIAGAIGALLALVSAVLVLLGVLFAPLLVSVLLAGFDGEKRELAIRFTRILFPGAALFVFFAWCLGILNSHRKFFLSYAAPVAWNAAMIVALLLYRQSDPAVLAYRIAWASVIGAGLQLLVMLPTVLRVGKGMRLWLGRGNASVRTVVRNFVPAFFGRGVVQISAFVDRVIASFLPGGISLLMYTQTLTMLPISLFGMAVSAAELPEMSSAVGSTDEVAAHVRARLNAGLRQIAFFVVPSALAFLSIGDAIIAALFEGGRFTAADTRFTWGILAAASVGLLATTLARLYSSAFYALHDTRTPLRFAIIRVTVAAALGYALAIHVPAALGIAPQWGAALLTLSSSVAGWLEFALLRSRMNARIGASGVAVRHIAVLFGMGIAAGAAGFAVKTVSAPLHQIVTAALAVAVFGVVYIGVAFLLGISEAKGIVRRIPGARG